MTLATSRQIAAHELAKAAKAWAAAALEESKKENLSPDEAGVLAMAAARTAAAEVRKIVLATWRSPE